MASEAKSKVLQDDSLIYQLTDTIDAVKYYFTLGRDLLGSQAAVSNIIGRTEPDYHEIVFKCLYTWRNANGRGSGAKLVTIFRGVGMYKAATYIEQELLRRPNCLSEDVFLQSLASKLDCASVYRKLGLPLLENNSAELSNLIGPVHISTAQYQDALFHVLIRWRNQEGSRRESVEKLKKILLKHKLTDTVQALNRMEYGEKSGPVYVAESDPATGRMDEELLGFDEDMETDGPSTIAPLSRQEFYDIYLVASSNETPYFRKMLHIIHNNGWRVQTPFDSKLGEPVLENIEKAVLNCSHLVFIITKEDCDNEDPSHTMTLEMAFQSLTDRGLGGRIIPVFCCDLSLIPLKLRSLTGTSIHDGNLERRLRNSIDVSIRTAREEEYCSVLGEFELSIYSNIDEPLPLISSSTATGYAPATSTPTGASSQCPEDSEGSEEGNIKPDQRGRYMQKMKPANPSHALLNDKERYNMDRILKGHMFMMNITRGRDGSEVDGKNAKHVFREIGYKIEYHENLKAKDLKDKLTKFVSSKKHNGQCSVAFMFMGHGCETGIECEDKKVVTTEYIEGEVYKMESMHEKPKMIFYQCCRGIIMAMTDR